MADNFLKINKTKKNKKEEFKEIPEAKISKPAKTYKQEDNQVKPKETPQREPKDEIRKSGFSKSYRMLRVSSETAARANAAKGALGLSSQDDIVAKGLDKIVSEFTTDQKRNYNMLIDVERIRYERK